MIEVKLASNPWFVPSAVDLDSMIVVPDRWEIIDWSKVMTISFNGLGNEGRLGNQSSKTCVVLLTISMIDNTTRGCTKI